MTKQYLTALEFDLVNDLIDEIEKQIEKIIKIVKYDESNSKLIADLLDDRNAIPGYFKDDKIDLDTLICSVIHRELVKRYKL